MIVYLCSCGFATDDAGWFEVHLDEHPGHHQRRMRDSPYQQVTPDIGFPFAPESLAGFSAAG